jgi:hypothetical protein
VSNFLLSPGITPELADTFVVLVPLVVGLGYLLGKRRGLELAFSGFAVILGGIKLYTDYVDLPDAVVAVLAILGGLLWGLLATGALPAGRGARLAGSVLAPLLVVVGAVKLRDFYDPFDILLADCAVVAGVALWLYAQRKLTGESRPNPELRESQSPADT